MLKNEVNYKALAFLAEQTASTFNYDVKGARAIWDPSLSIPGTNRRGGWRCPVGTRYGGQITDRYGRSCGWGVARRIANQIADIGERLENVDDRKRNARLAKRNARVQRFLARQGKPGLLERGARGLADALDGGDAGKPMTAPRPPARPRIPVQNPARIEPPARPRVVVGEADKPTARKPAGVPRRRGNLRESEARRMERELVQPGAPRTGEPPKPNAPRGRRRNAAQQGAKRTVRRKPEADFVDGSNPAPTAVPQRRPAPPKPAAPPAPPARPPAPKAPVRPAGPPPMPARDINPDSEFDQPRDADLVKIVKDDIQRYKPNAYNNLRGKPKEEVLGKKIQDQELLKQAQAGFDEALKDWQSKKNGNMQERDEARDRLLRMYSQKEKIKDGIDAAELRIVEIDAGIEFRQRPPIAGANNNAGVPAQPRPQIPMQPPQRPVEVPLDPSKIDVSPPSVKKDYKNEIGKLGADGLPDIEPIPVGNKGINSKNEAIDFLKNGGSIAEVPDEFLVDAIKRNVSGANPRFEEKRPDRQGVNDTIKYKDTLNGKTYYLKYHSRIGTNNEDVHEIVGNNIAGRMGMPVGQYRLDGVMQDGKHRAVLLEDVRNYMNGDVMEPANRGADILPADKIRATLLDFVIVNIDRHHGNFFQVVQDGKKRFAPIDPSLGFDAKWGGERRFSNIEPNEAGLRAFLASSSGGGRNGMLKGLADDKRAGRVHRDEVVAAIASVQKSIKDAEAKNAYKTFAGKAKNVAIVEGQEAVRSTVKKYVIDKPDARMKFIADIDPSRLADILLGL